ncbi:MAG: hypothetical protein GKR94_16830 [Gammaproteobacteria bacterium]|nr:hypothetical protein [Gammaproteobacteria bacterium]
MTEGQWDGWIGAALGVRRARPQLTQLDCEGADWRQMERGVHRLQVRMAKAIDAKAIDVVAGVREGVLKGLSPMMGNYHVRFFTGAEPGNGLRLLGECPSRSSPPLCIIMD